MRVQVSDLMAGWPPTAITATGLQIVAVHTPEMMETTDTDRNTAVATPASFFEAPLNKPGRKRGQGKKKRAQQILEIIPTISKSTNKSQIVTPPHVKEEERVERF